jgi:hypothetical protein
MEGQIDEQLRSVARDALDVNSSEFGRGADAKKGEETHKSTLVHLDSVDGERAKLGGMGGDSLAMRVVVWD